MPTNVFSSYLRKITFLLADLATHHNKLKEHIMPSANTIYLSLKNKTKPKTKAKPKAKTKPKEIKVKVKKYSYTFLFDDKGGDYLSVREDILDANKLFQKAFTGSGLYLMDDSFDINFKCTPAVYKKLAAYIRRHYSKCFVSVDRCNP